MFLISQQLVGAEWELISIVILIVGMGGRGVKNELLSWIVSFEAFMENIFPPNWWKAKQETVLGKTLGQRVIEIDRRGKFLMNLTQFLKVG